MTHLVTGAGSGIGAAVARRLHDRGDELVLLARTAERAAQLEALFPGARGLVGDLADPAGLERSLAGAALPDALESVVHAAGVVDLGPVADLDAATWREHLDVNLAAPAILTRALLPALRSARGLVLFVNSGAGLSANPGWSAYAASKFGLRALADSLRAEEKERGVRVTTIFPGRTATPMQARVHELEGREYDASRFIDPETVAGTALHVLDLPRDATISDLTVQTTPTRGSS